MTAVPSPAPAADAPMDPQSQRPGPPQRVLVVEDLEDTRASLVDLLRMGLGLEVDAAEDGQQALAMLAERPYALVVTDLRMPRLGGMRLIQEMRDRNIPATVIV